ncbi:MAG TPA: DUF2254 family protein [Pseudomonadales bacterium]
MSRTSGRRSGEPGALRPLGAFVGLAVVAGLLLVASAAADGIPWRGLLLGGRLREALAGSAEVVAAVLAIAVTVVAIVVELAANRYSHLITRLFVREPANLLVLGLFVITTLQCLWFGPWLGSAAERGARGSVVTMTLVTVSLLSLLPYVYYVFNFLSPISIIDKIHANAVRVMRRAPGGRAAVAQEAVCRAVDELQDVARSAVVRGDRDIAMAAVDALAALIEHQHALRGELQAEWFAIGENLARDPDFVALADETLEEIATHGVWLETKVLRRLVALVGQSTGQLRDVANLIAIQTRRLAVGPGLRRPELMTVCVRAFNSYLRTALNAKDMRTAYYVQNQYRLVAEALLAVPDAARVEEIAGHLGYYGQLAYRAGMPFLLETAAHDLAQLLAAALDRDDAVVDALLDRLLELDQEVREEAEEESLLGVRRAQIRTATMLLARGQHERARRIARDLAPERPERLRRLRHGLETDERPQYWELIDRGMNFAYLAPELRRHLPTLFDWIAAERPR